MHLPIHAYSWSCLNRVRLINRVQWLSNSCIKQSSSNHQLCICLLCLRNGVWPCWLANSSGSPLLWFLHPANPASRKRKVCKSLKNQGFFLQRFERECKQRKEIKSHHVYLNSFLQRTTHAAQPVAWQLPKVKLCKTGGQLVTFLMTFAKAIHIWA